MNEQRGKVAAIGIAQAPRPVIVFGEEERRIHAVERVVVEELIHRSQESFELFHSYGALAAQVGLQVRHQEGCSHPFTSHVRNYKSQPFLAKIEKVVVVTAYRVRLQASARIIK